MAEEKLRSDWWHTASLLASIRNIFAGKGKTVSVAECHPMEQQKRKVVPLSILRDVFCKK